LDLIAGGEKDLNVFTGWRNEVFGHDALRLREGKVALSANGKNVLVVEI
jgi:ribonuclease D